MRGKKTTAPIRTAVASIVLAIAVCGGLAIPVAAQGGEVAAWDLTRGKAVRCAELSTDGSQQVKGGCLVFASGKIDLTVRTMFGPVRFGRCAMAFNLVIGPDGRIVRDGFAGQGGGACGDMLPCREKVPAANLLSAAKLPWDGQIDRGPSAYRSEFDMCLDTCMGRFEGAVAFDLVERRGDWRMRAVNSVAGVSGFELDGEWDLDVPYGVSAAYVKREGSDAPGFDLR